ncbi:hypothetical protein [Methanothrix soehngenii]|uniref:hypothetical protein n=1 Tax=Methanothrix soehngenii TaxID=2223 RepID=UPI0023F17C2E|nr:hypothetical protein [Methanothrix soehngenii]MDD5734803.1 hypothetical protein [Methanothrix soehngenii]
MPGSMQAQTSGLPGMVQLLLEHISQHLCSEKVISAQEIAAFASGLDNIQNIYAEIAERYSIKLDERRDAKKAIYDALKEIEAERRCCE